MAKKIFEFEPKVNIDFKPSSSLATSQRPNAQNFSLFLNEQVYPMAIVFLDKSKCPVCGQLLTKRDEIWALPPVSDSSNPLFRYFDAGIHRSCFETWDKKDEAIAIVKKEVPGYTPPI